MTKVLARTLPLTHSAPAVANEVHDYRFEAVIGSSPAIATAKALLGRIAGSPVSTVLLTGETGTGKDLAAKVIHYNGARADKPFAGITCSAVPDLLLESELFGHESGAFSDAREQKCGLFESADGGTVFLDEISEMSVWLQGKLLRVLESRTFRRIGGTRDIHVNVRVIAASSQNLEAGVSAGSFRQDLLYRLAVMAVMLPPLRERGDDVVALTKHFIDRYNAEFHKAVRSLTPAAVARLTEHTWPGNVRELRNTIERAVLLADGDRIGAHDILLPKQADGLFRLPANGVDLRELEQQLLQQALERTHGNHTLAGRLLGINRDQVRYRVQKMRAAAAAAPGTATPVETADDEGPLADAC